MVGRSQHYLEPGYCVVDTPGTLSTQAGLLFRGRNTPAARYFMQLNADTPWLKPGQILLVADPDNPRQTYPLNQLRQAKRQVNQSMAFVSPEQGGFLQQHYDTLAAVLVGTEKGISFGSDAGKQYSQRIDQLLRKIESTYQNQFRTQGTLVGQQFYAERRRLFGELNSLLQQPLAKRIAYRALKLRPYENLRHALGLSSRSIVHHWSNVGVGAIPGYAAYLEASARAVKYMKTGGWIGLGVAGLSATNDIYHACTVGRESECPAVAIKGYTAFAGSVVVGYGGGAIGATAGATVCVALGIITAPAAGAGGLVCGLVGGTVGGLIGGAAGEKGGEKLGGYISHLIFN
ncbi:hypothetical protein RBA71_07340 [Brenneria goodwinii]|uniref:hypothetical protein n=1 Tax=Brenneria goodwinii TaxID=1109412 RepID=UPI0036EA4AF3